MKRPYLLIVPVVMLAWGCSANPKANSDPYYSTFFEKARLIMTSEEVEIYKHLPDASPKEAFIEEFWKKRDPDPLTPENENQIEFERRIDYANRWFRERRAAGRGWDTIRGRILIQLGEPERRDLMEMLNPSEMTRYGFPPDTKGVERWIYQYYQFVLYFIDTGGYGEYKLVNWPPALISAIDRAKFTLELLNPDSLKRVFSFEAEYDGKQFVITIPIKKINFEEKEGKMAARFKIAIYVYRDYQKKEVIEEHKEFTGSKEELLDRKSIQLSIPYPIKENGKYFFDIIGEDEISAGKYRSYLKYNQ